MPRVALLIPSQTYRATDFVAAARRIAVDLVVVSDHRQAWESEDARSLVVDFADPDQAAAVVLSRAGPLDAVVAVDDAGVVPAALIADRLGLPGNPPSAARATRDKAAMRIGLRAARVPQPAFAIVEPGADGRDAVDHVGFPVVVKPVHLSASRGVIRCDRADAFDGVLDRVRAIAGPDATVLVEEFVPGDEVAVEGIVTDGALDVLAVFDKPDPLDGPYFPETIYVTPSRHDHAVVRRVTDALDAAARAIGLRDGPLHGEARISPAGDAVVLEVAARTIGGLCSRTLQFGLGVSLEELVLRHALGRSLGNIEPVAPAAGVLMLPASHGGVFESIDGLDRARAVPGIAGIEITITPGSDVVPLPEGDRYLGFVFARGADPAMVETALRTAWSHLTVRVT